MWNRVLLKERGKAAFKANYWKCVLVALILGLIVGGGPSYSGGFNVGNRLNDNDVIENYQDNNDVLDDFDDDSLTENWNIEEFDDIDEIPDVIPPGNGSGNNALLTGGIAAIILIVILIAIAFGAVLGILVFNPLEVGCRKFFMENSEGRGDDVGIMAYGFKTNYGNIVKVQFFRSLFIFLWSLLLLVPGIIKAFEYRLVPYLLAENPNMDRKEALETSKRLMYGNKMDAFVLDLSFFGWMILEALTLGLLGLFYVRPYVFATEAELYRVLSGKVSGFEDKSEDEVDLAKLYGGVRDDGEDVYVTFETPDDTTTHD